MKPVALLICGALGREVKAIVDGHGWEVDVYGVPALLHFYPKKIVEAGERPLAQLSPRYARGGGVYGDCGTGGAPGGVPGPPCARVARGAPFLRVFSRGPAAP